MSKNAISDTTKKVIIGAGIVAGAVLAAYLLTSPKDRKKSVAEIKGWMIKMQKEIAGKVKKVRHLTEEKYSQIVDEVKPKYEALKDVSAAEFSSFVDETKSHWRSISGVARKISKK